MVIYKTTNLVNGRFYVGKDARNRRNYLGSGKVLRRAIDKYGKASFKKEILEYCKDLKQLDEREKYWIKELDAVELGYNLTEGGTGGDTHGDTPHPNWGFKPGHIPWNKGVKMSDEFSQNIIRILKSKDLKPNCTSYKPGKDHVYYGTKQSNETVQKRVETRRKNGSYKGVGKFAPKKVKHIEEDKIFGSIKDAAEYYGLTRDQVGHSCRKETKKGKFRFV